MALPAANGNLIALEHSGARYAASYHHIQFSGDRHELGTSYPASSNLPLPFYQARIREGIYVFGDVAVFFRSAAHRARSFPDYCHDQRRHLLVSHPVRHWDKMGMYLYVLQYFCSLGAMS